MSSVLSKSVGSCDAASSTHSLSSGSHSVTTEVAHAKEWSVRGTYYLCVDSTQPSRILIRFSALLPWGDKAVDGELLKVLGSAHPRFEAAHYNLRAAELPSPCIIIKTTYSKAAVLQLPAGRHVLSFSAFAKLGYHVHLCSTTPLIFGDEETVLSHLVKESALFMMDASSILKALSSVVSSFSDEEKLSPARDALEKAHTPQKIATNPRQHLTVFNSAVYKILRQALGGKLTSDDQFAIIALINEPSFQPADQEDEPPSPNGEPESPESADGGEPTDGENQAGSPPQAGAKGHSLRQNPNASKPGTEENLRASKILSELWPKILPHAEKHAVLLLRGTICCLSSTPVPISQQRLPSDPPPGEEGACTNTQGLADERRDILFLFCFFV
ncbi:androglobin-like [Nelusetta ayraudi]|uniref:androglobin-like n=1 Tax=Nelusetta ayraudi TaxID=303726 RepID=UPI003F6EE702